MGKFTTFLAYAMMLLVASSCNNNVGTEEVDPLEDGDRRFIRQGETTREYLLQVPDTYSVTEPAPLIINMHGYGGNVDDYRKYVGGETGLQLLADQREFFVAYPQAYLRDGLGERFWQTGDNGEQDIAKNDVYYIERLLADIKAEYNIDEEQIFALGFSNGGMMAYSLGCNRGDVFAAVGGMATTMIPEECNKNHTPSIIAFHGTDDSVLPYEGNVAWQAVPDVMEFWADHNGLSTQDLQSTTYDEGAVRLEVYPGDEASVVLYTIEGGGHVWFSRDINGRTPNEILWDFLEDIRL
ncbi:MAG: PHB depolymerase family esterase [Balneolaceae bacterium]|nr:PHB depolymerase family esterase [Balneolaceae bacterium]